EKMVRFDEFPRIIVGEDLTDCEKLVSSTRRSLERADRGTDGILSGGYQDHFLSVSVSRKQLNRSLIILDALIKAFKEGGVRTVAENPPECSSSAFVVGRETIMFSVRELTKRLKNEGTEKFGASKW